MPRVSNPQFPKITDILEESNFGQKYSDPDQPTHPSLEHAWFCLSTWDPCVFEQNFDIKKQLRLRPGDCGFSNVKTKCDESTNYYILLCILKTCPI